MNQAWEALDTDAQLTLLRTIDTRDLARRFGKGRDFFEQASKFYGDVPSDTASKQEQHYPPKALIMNARRDLSFFEANFELIDNSIDEWRKNGAKKDLAIRIKYDLELLVGEYEDDAGGMKEEDVYKVFIPGESTNNDYTQQVIGSFGMGAKKAIFRLSDGAKVISCTDREYSATSAVPQNWEKSPLWVTTDGRCPPIGAGVTRFYFLKLLMPPTLDDLSALHRRVQTTYGPLLRDGEGGHKVRVLVNDVAVDPPPPIEYSGAEGLEPRTYVFSHTFKNLLKTGLDIKLEFRFTCGLLTKLPGLGAGREEDWGIDVYGNGRLIQRFLKREFGFGRSGMGMQNAGAKLVRGELLIYGHSLGIPWDTHKREYLKDHEVSYWIQKAVAPRIKDYFTYAGRLAGDTKLRNTELSKPNTNAIKTYEIDPARVVTEARPAWKLKGSATAKPKGASTSTATSTPSSQDPIAGDEQNGQGGTGLSTIELTLTEADLIALVSRFAVKNEEELPTAIAECLSNGVAFRLEPDQLRAALTLLDVDTAADLSDKIKGQLLKRLEKSIAAR